MRKGKKKFLTLWFVAVLSAAATSRPVLANDGDAKNGAPAKTAGARLDAPGTGLTERERWLLEKVGQLEMRVAELESKSQPAAVSAVGPSVPAPAAAPAVSSSMTAAMAPSPGAVKQTSEQGTTAKPEKAVPFAFADFT